MQSFISLLTVLIRLFSSQYSKDADFGLISYHDDQGIVQILQYFPKDISFSKSIPEFGSKVKIVITNFFNSFFRHHYTCI